MHMTENNLNISIFRKSDFLPVHILFLERRSLAVGRSFFGNFFLVYQINGSSWKPFPGKEEQLGERQRHAKQLSQKWGQMH